jgi:hypothetical protein
MFSLIKSTTGPVRCIFFNGSACLQCFITYKLTLTMISNFYLKCSIGDDVLSTLLDNVCKICGVCTETEV